MSVDAKVESNTKTFVEAADATLVASDNPSWLRLKPPTRSRQFILAAIIIIGLSMTFVGSLVSQQIEQAAARSAGEGAAIYMEAFLSKHVQELARSRQLSPSSVQAIDQLMTVTSLRGHIISVNIWLTDGSNVYSTSLPQPKDHHSAKPIEAVLQGHIFNRKTTLDVTTHGYERRFGDSFYETYVPLREYGTDRIIAIGEFYELEHEISGIHHHVWLIIGCAALAMLSLLYAFVRHGDRIIERQQAILRQQITEQGLLYRQNVSLQRRAANAGQHFATINELTQRRIGADLHDGPAQLLTLILLRLDELAESCSDESRDALESIRSAAQDSLREIRDLSCGLALPEISKLSVREELQLAVQRHEQRSLTRVQLTLGPLPETLALSHKICLYRLVQEALHNAFLHAGGLQQRVEAQVIDGILTIEVVDGGPGMDLEQLRERPEHRSRLGLAGMRYRVESLGGTFDIVTAPGQGTRIVARFDLHQRGEQADS
ncbi:histidine kinase [Ectopseudomonas composti]|uniref:histidine kinase n=1 Tax=Ectopseudomonas composti TaxID=658457 RepID=A0ABP3BUD1_9GAMM|nr:ATP-binding protein [Pseudomonas composti]EZH79514.1 histidine kinase [Pseudomonas composti]